MMALVPLVGGWTGGAAAWSLILPRTPLAMVLTIGVTCGKGGRHSIILVQGAALALAIGGMLLCLTGKNVRGTISWPGLMALRSLATLFAAASSG